MSTRLLMTSLTLTLLAACGRGELSSVKEAWNAENDPLRLGGGYERHLATLPAAAELERTPWSDTYWPSYQGGIANRWHSLEERDGFAYTAPTRDAVKAMSASDLAMLSPAEKYDILVGNYDYPLVSYERSRTNATKPTWEGLCHGWAPAALNFAEPHPVLVETAEGVKIPFGSSDVKALLTLVQGNFATGGFKSLGARCNIDLSTNPDAADSDACRDTNAGAFHVVITNFLALRHEGFVADVTRDLQVWNQPVHGFSTRILGKQPPSPGAAIGTTEEALVETDMIYTVEVSPRWNALTGTAGHADRTAHYRYRLELDAAGDIIGGAWLDEERPDFLWVKEKPTFTNYFEALGKLYDQSVSAADLADPVHP